MKDNEIIKDLENEVKSAEYVDNYYCNSVDLTLIKSAIDLINRLQAEIDELKHERKVLIEDIHCSADKINEQLEEIEKLERTISYLECVCESTPDKVRTEAIEEFVEKLKKHYDNPVWYLGGSNGFFDNLDNFVKEMVGDIE